jgi:23S rRNA pseudouridine2605 synthase
MPFKNTRDSRDEKSKRTSGPSAKSKSFKSDKTESTNNTKKKLPSDDSKRPFKSGFKKTDDKPGSNFSSEKRSPKSFGRSGGAEERPSGERSYNRKPLGDKPFGDRPQGNKPQGDKPYGNRPSGEKRPFGDRPQGDKPQGGKPQGGKPYGNRPSGEKRPFGDRPQGDKPQGDRPQSGKPFASRENKYSDKNAPAKRFNDKPFKSRVKEEYSSSDRPKLRSDDQKWSSEERFVNKRSKKPAPPKEDDGLIRLNRFIANAGICSRRKADELIAAGVVSVNGEPVTELGFKVDPAKDSVRYNGESLKRERNVYVLLNKPKDYITTTDDPQERKTVMSLVEKASRERIYPVGRLDRNTTGLLLMTNDGDLAEKLSHPRNNITKLYQVELNKSLSQGDMNKITFGIELEDGLIKPDQVSYVAGGSKKEVGIQIHSGKNRVVRRIFESLGYEVVKLDRVVYSHLTKKDLPRGRWRYLEEKEIIQLKHLIK